MKIINSEMLNNLELTQLGGAEAEIFVTKDNNIYKEFHSNTSLKILKNKENKLLLLDQIKEVKDIYPMIHGLVYNDKLTGYIQERFTGFESDEIFLTFEEKIDILKKLKNYIIRLKQNRIYYFDLMARNILIDPSDDNEIKLIDMDNIMIDKYNYDIQSNSVSRYLISGGKDIDSMLIYSFNYYSLLFVLGTSVTNLSLLDKKNIYDLFNNIEQKRLVKNLIRKKINTDCDNEYLIDYF